MIVPFSSGRKRRSHQTRLAFFDLTQPGHSLLVPPDLELAVSDLLELAQSGHGLVY